MAGGWSRRVDLSRSPARDIAPTVSPDGKRIAFASDRGGRARLDVVGSGGGAATAVSRALFPVGASDGLIAQIAWSPSSRQLAIAASGSNAPPVLYVGGLDGRGRVVRRGTVIDGPAWSPDGRLVVFTTGVGPSGNRNETRVVDRDGAAAWRVGGNQVRHPAWSARGRLAVDVGSRTIRVYREDGRRLSSFPGRGFAWSPSGDRLASMNGVRLELRRGGTDRPTLSVPLLTPSQIFRPDAQNGVAWFGSSRVGVATGDGWIVGTSRPAGRRGCPARSSGRPPRTARGRPGKRPRPEASR